MTQYEVDVRESTAVVGVIGDVDISTVDGLERAIRSAAGSNLIIDLSKTTFLDSSGVGALIRSFKRARTDGTTLCIVCDGENTVVTKVLGLLGVGNLVPVFMSVRQAELAALT